MSESERNNLAQVANKAAELLSAEFGTAAETTDMGGYYRVTVQHKMRGVAEETEAMARARSVAQKVRGLAQSKRAVVNGDTDVDEVHVNVKRQFGDEVEVGRYLYTQKDPADREEIGENGLEPRADYGDGLLFYPPSVFATDSEDPDDWYESDKPTDTWRIDVEIMLRDRDPYFNSYGKGWQKDPNYTDVYGELDTRHVVTHQSIPATALTLWRKAGSNRTEESRTLRYTDWLGYSGRS